MNIDLSHNAGDVVYHVHEFRVVKVVIEEIDIKINKKGKVASTTYFVSQYGVNDPKNKNVAVEGAYLVKDFKTAKESALTNWGVITEQVTTRLNTLTDDMFEPKGEDESK